MVARDDFARLADGRAERVERRPRNDLVLLAPQHDHGEFALLQVLQLGGEVGVAGQVRDLPEGTRVSYEVRHGVLEDHGEHLGEVGDRQEVAREVDAPVPQRPIGHRAQGRTTPSPRRPADRVDEHQRAHAVGEVVCDLDCDATSERMPDEEHRLLRVDRFEEGVDPARVARERELVTRQVGRAAEARQGGSEDLAAQPDEPLQRPLVRMLAEPPTVEEDDREPNARDPVERLPPRDLSLAPDEMLTQVIARHREHDVTGRERLPHVTGEKLLALELVEATPDAVGLADAEGVLEAGLADRARGADRLGPGLACLLLLLALELRRREEDGGVRPATGRFQLPELLGTLRHWRHPPSEGHPTPP